MGAIFAARRSGVRVRLRRGKRGWLLRVDARGSFHRFSLPAHLPPWGEIPRPPKRLGESAAIDWAYAVLDAAVRWFNWPHSTT